ncbi:MAG: hypothetical protein ACRDPY_39710 [Streptosporangiaceae bacterium]
MATIVAFHAHPDDEVLLSYDPNGGYRHRDHIKVHQVGARAAELAGVRLLVALPVPVYGLICGREWFVEPGAAPAGRRGDILAKAA